MAPTVDKAVAVFSKTNNKLVGQSSARLWRNALVTVLGAAWLFMAVGRTRRRTSIRPPDPFHPWLLPSIVCFVVASAGFLAAPNFEGTPQFLCRVFGALVIFTGCLPTIIFPCFLSRLCGVPKRESCQLKSLPQQEAGKPHPLLPYHKETKGLFAYVPGLVWVAQMPLQVDGAQLGARMVVVPISSGSKDLLVYSPIKLTDEIKADLKKIGTVRQLLAPNAYHHMFLQEWKTEYPDVKLIAAPGLEDRRPDIEFDALMSAMPVGGEWPESDTLLYCVVMGHGFSQDVCVYDSRSKTLLVSEVMCNVHHQADQNTGGGRYWNHLMSLTDRVGPRLWYKLSVVEPSKLRQSIDYMLKWGFERAIPCHGRMVDTDARRALHDAFAFID